MFWTSHEDAQSAVLRAISGGPVYFSDPVGTTDPARVWPMIYRDGRIARRPAGPADSGLPVPQPEHGADSVKGMEPGRTIGRHRRF